MPFGAYFDKIGDPDFGSDFVTNFLETQRYNKKDLSGTECPVSFTDLFSRYLFMDIKFDGCKSCAVAFQFLVLLHLGLQEKLNWVQNGKNQDPYIDI